MASLEALQLNAASTTTLSLGARYHDCGQKCIPASVEAAANAARMYAAQCVAGCLQRLLRAREALARACCYNSPLYTAGERPKEMGAGISACYWAASCARQCVTSRQALPSQLDIGSSTETGSSGDGNHHTALASSTTVHIPSTYSGAAPPLQVRPLDPGNFTVTSCSLYGASAVPSSSAASSCWPQASSRSKALPRPAGNAEPKGRGRLPPAVQKACQGLPSSAFSSHLAHEEMVPTQSMQHISISKKDFFRVGSLSASSQVTNTLFTCYLSFIRGFSFRMQYKNRTAIRANEAVSLCCAERPGYGCSQDQSSR